MLQNTQLYCDPCFNALCLTNILGFPLKMNFSGNHINWKICHSDFTLRKQFFQVFPIIQYFSWKFFLIINIYITSNACLLLTLA